MEHVCIYAKHLHKQHENKIWQPVDSFWKDSRVTKARVSRRCSSWTQKPPLHSNYVIHLHNVILHWALQLPCPGWIYINVNLSHIGNNTVVLLYTCSSFQDAIYRLTDMCDFLFFQTPGYWCAIFTLSFCSLPSLLVARQWVRGPDWLRLCFWTHWLWFEAG